MELLFQGAEAKIYEKNGTIHKERIEKTYRHFELDTSLRKFRTNREAKILKKLEEIAFPAPRLLRKETFTIIMEKIRGPPVKDVFILEHAKEIGRLIGILHSHDIIHGDLTTSNMILNEEEGKLYFIDFGLAQISKKREDKAVDLHLLKHALESKHWDIANEAFNIILEEYSKQLDAKEILKRLDVVELRGRNKGKGD